MKKKTMILYVRIYLPLEEDFLDPISAFHNLFQKPGEKQEWHINYRFLHFSTPCLHSSDQTKFKAMLSEIRRKTRQEVLRHFAERSKDEPQTRTCQLAL